MEVINGDIYVMYYEPGIYSIEALKNMFDKAKKAVSPKPVIALPSNISLKGFSKKDFLSIVSQVLGGDINDLSEPPSDIDAEEDAKWKTWGGWRGNHDRRIEGATCTKCGYEHPTVYGDLRYLGSYCPRCGRKITGVVEY